MKYINAYFHSKNGPIFNPTLILPVKKHPSELCNCIFCILGSTRCNICSNAAAAPRPLLGPFNINEHPFAV